jgi:hypothetical protein
MLMIFICLEKTVRRNKITENLLDANNEVSVEVHTEELKLYSCFVATILAKIEI